MAKVYTKIPLENKRELNKAVRSILQSCKSLSRGKSVKRVLDKVHEDKKPIIISTLFHTKELINNSITINSSKKNNISYLNRISYLMELIEITASKKKNGLYKPIKMKRITDLIKYHSKSFKVLDTLEEIRPNSVNIEIDNDSWCDVNKTAIMIWGNNAYDVNTYE